MPDNFAISVVPGSATAVDIVTQQAAPWVRIRQLSGPRAPFTVTDVGVGTVTVAAGHSYTFVGGFTANTTVGSVALDGSGSNSPDDRLPGGPSVAALFEIIHGGT